MRIYSSFCKNALLFLYIDLKFKKMFRSWFSDNQCIEKLRKQKY